MLWRVKFIFFCAFFKGWRLWYQQEAAVCKRHVTGKLKQQMCTQNIHTHHESVGKCMVYCPQLYKNLSATCIQNTLLYLLYVVNNSWFSKWVMIMAWKAAFSLYVAAFWSQCSLHHNNCNKDFHPKMHSNPGFHHNHQIRKLVLLTNNTLCKTHCVATCLTAFGSQAEQNYCRPNNVIWKDDLLNISVIATRYSDVLRAVYFYLGCFPTSMTRSWTTHCPESLSSTCGPVDHYRTSYPTSGNRAGSPVAKTKPTTFSPTSPCVSSLWWDVLFSRFCEVLDRAQLTEILIHHTPNNDVRTEVLMSCP